MTKLNPDIIFEDDNFLILNKPAGTIVNNADTSRNEYTVQDYISENFKSLALNSQVDSEFSKRGGIVHRLDKDTSGALIVALNEESFAVLQKQFKERTVRKEYIALVHGKLVSEGEINVPIGRLPWNRMRFGVIPQGREAYTKFKVISYHYLNVGKQKEEVSLVRVFPQTGRTHQIRVHMQYAGHPIFADNLYGGRKTIARDRKFLQRHFLHASKIQFVSPTSGRVVEFEAPLPLDLQQLVDSLS